MIGDFVHGTDKIDISAYGFTSFSQVQAGISQVAGDGAVALAAGDFLVLLGVNMASLDSSDFILS